MAYYELKITAGIESRNNFITLLARKGCLGFIEDDKDLTAYFPGTFNIYGLTGELELVRAVLDRAGLRNQLEFSYRLVPEQDWNESWKKGFRPLDVGERFTILPPWEKKHENRINLIIDPGMAFGTGHHETTRSCLVLMEKYDGHVAKGRFLDLGAGTGLLAIAASKLGYKQAIAVDTDPLAVEAVSMNIKFNSVENVEIREGSITQASSSFDCIAANIISGILIDLAPEISSRLNRPGIGILSGILREQADEVITEMEKGGLKLLEKFPADKWMSLVVQKR